MLLMDKASPISGEARGFVRFGENAADTQLAGGERLQRQHLTFEVYPLGIKVLSKQTIVELTGEQPE